MRMRKFAFMLLMMFTLMFGTTSYCQDLDSINQSQQTGDGSASAGDESYNNVADALRGYNALDDESMAKANKLASPIVSLIGVITGWILLVTFAGVFLVTAIDLAYIAIPFTRNWINPSGAQQGGGAMPGGTGMGMGMGMGMQGAGAQQGGASAGKHYCSDEAIQALMSANQQGQQGGVGGAGGMGMGMGMYGGAGMQQQSQMPPGGKSVIMTYLKKRTFFMILFAVSATILMSSVLFDCGLNIAELLYKIVRLFSDGIGGVQM